MVYDGIDSLLTRVSIRYYPTPLDGVLQSNIAMLHAMLQMLQTKFATFCNILQHRYFGVLTRFKGQIICFRVRRSVFRGQRRDWIKTRGSGAPHRPAQRHIVFFAFAVSIFYISATFFFFF